MTRKRRFEPDWRTMSVQPLKKYEVWFTSDVAGSDEYYEARIDVLAQNEDEAVEIACKKLWAGTAEWQIEGVTQLMGRQ